MSEDLRYLLEELEPRNQPMARAFRELKRQQRGHGLAFSPLQLASLAAWYQYKVGITEAGTGVSQWADQSGNARHVVQGTDANRPSNVNGEITFNGTSDILKSSTFTLAQPFTVYLWAKTNTHTAGDCLFGGNAVDVLLQQQNPSGDIQMHAGSNAPSATMGLGVYKAIACVFNGASSIIHVSSGGSPTTGNSGTNSMGAISLGARGDLSSWADVIIKEAIFYAAAHDAGTRIQVLRYLESLL